nr:hypothetical protein [Tanacetum cinerariifolium]
KSESANRGVYAMIRMETYMGNKKEKCECGLDVDGRKHTSQINKLKVFISVSNEGYQFVEVFNLKTDDVCIMEYKKEDKAEIKNHTKPNKKVEELRMT